MKKLNRFFLIVTVSVILTRLWTISLFFLFKPYPQVMQTVINDPLHHYQVGLVMLIIAYLLRKHSYSGSVGAIGLGIFLEELPVFLGDIGLGTTIYYHSGYDLVITLTLIGLFYLLFCSHNFEIFTKHS